MKSSWVFLFIRNKHLKLKLKIQNFHYALLDNCQTLILSIHLKHPLLWINKQVVNPQKGVSGPHCFKMIHSYIAPKVNSWRSESSNKGLVILTSCKLNFSSGNFLEKWFKQCKLGCIRYFTLCYICFLLPIVYLLSCSSFVNAAAATYQWIPRLLIKHKSV